MWGPVAVLLVLVSVGSTADVPRTAARGAPTKKVVGAFIQSKVKISPLEKVVAMLNGMLGKAESEKQEEKVRFAAYTQFCKSMSAEKTDAIARGTEAVDKLKADIGEADADAAQMAKDIGVLDGDITSWEGERKETVLLRGKAHEAYEKAHDEYDDSIDSVKRALETIKAGPTSLAQTSLLELGAKPLLTEKARRLIVAFLQSDKPSYAYLQDGLEFKKAETAMVQDGMDFAMSEEAGAPEAAAFESQSGGVLGVVEGLGNKFEDEKSALEKKEMNEKHAADMIVEDLTDQIQRASKEREKKASFKAEREEKSADAKGELADTTKTLAEDTKFLSDLSSECQGKSVDFEQRQTTRQGEIEAINKAIEIMSSDTVSGVGLVQTKATASLAQLRSVGQSSRQGIAVAFLRGHAKRTKSKILSLLATKIKDSPFSKVSKMVKDMIQKLQQEAIEEAEHEGFCNTEMGTNKMTRDTKTDEVAGLKATVEDLTAKIAKLTEEMAALSGAIAENDAAVSKATEEREAEKAKNAATIADATGARDATGQALEVLKNFYEKAATSTPASKAEKLEGPINWDRRAMAIMGGGTGAAMVQVPGAPETFGEEAYTGMANGGVMGMLEVIVSDFARLVTETTASEADSQRAFEEFSADSAQDKAVKTQAATNKSQERTQKETALLSAKKDMKGSQTELDAAMAYFEKLKPSCVAVGESYADRVTKRKEEIESLKEALNILGGGI